MPRRAQAQVQPLPGSTPAVITAVIVGGIAAMILSFVNLGAALVALLLGAVAVGYHQPRRWWLGALLAWPWLLALTIHSWSFRGAPELQVVISENQLRLEPTVIGADELRLTQRNIGTEVHELAIFAPRLPSGDGSVVPEDLERYSPTFTLRPLRPGSKSTVTLDGRLESGVYLIGCIRGSDGQHSHLAAGEAAVIRVEGEP